MYSRAGFIDKLHGQPALTTPSPGLKKRSTQRAPTWSRETATSRRTKKHRNANINPEEDNGQGKKQESTWRRKRLPHHGAGRNEHGFVGGCSQACHRNGGWLAARFACRRHREA